MAAPLPPATVFDIDGTISSAEWRRHHLTADPPRHGTFFDLMGGDRLIPEAEAWVRSAEANGDKVVYATARPIQYYRVTEWWLMLNRLPRDGLYMRARSDFRKDVVVKRELLRRIRRLYNVHTIYEDSDAVAAMYVEEGVPCVVHCSDPALPPDGLDPPASVWAEDSLVDGIDYWQQKPDHNECLNQRCGSIFTKPRKRDGHLVCPTCGSVGDPPFGGWRAVFA